MLKLDRFLSSKNTTAIDVEEKYNLKCAYHILSKLGLDDHTYTHLSSRPADADYYYIYPFGLRFSEVSENKLLKISLDGEVLEGSEYQYNKTGYVIHGNIYKARAEICSIFHIHTTATVSVSCVEEGLMPISQWALHFYDKVSYHEYNSLTLDDEIHGKKLVTDLAQNYVLFLRNHGVITVGRTIYEAMFYTYHLEQACRCQVAALSMNRKLIIPLREKCKQANHDLLNFEVDLGKRDWDAWLRLLEVSI